MSDSFEKFMDAEIKEILNSMDEQCRKDPESCKKVAIEWIEKNAERFRQRWNAKNKNNLTSGII